MRGRLRDVIRRQHARIYLAHHMTCVTDATDLIFLVQHIDVARDHAVFLDNYHAAQRDSRHATDIGCAVDAELFAAADVYR